MRTVKILLIHRGNEFEFRVINENKMETHKMNTMI